MVNIKTKIRCAIRNAIMNNSVITVILAKPLTERIPSTELFFCLGIERHTPITYQHYLSIPPSEKIEHRTTLHSDGTLRVRVVPHTFDPKKEYVNNRFIYINHSFFEKHNMEEIAYSGASIKNKYKSSFIGGF